MRQLLLTTNFIWIAFISFGQPDPLSTKNDRLEKLLVEVTDYPGFKNAWVAFHAIDLKSQEVIASQNSSKALKPGSTLKLLTTATALELLGPNFQFKTQLEYSGELDTLKRVMNGDIYIKGGGDPTLGSEYFEVTDQHLFLKEWVEEIKKLEIDSINGRIIGDASNYGNDMMPETWTWGNMGNYFGASPCGLSVFDNSYAVQFKTSANIGEKTEIVSINPAMPWLQFMNEVIADSVSGDNVTIFGVPYSNQIILKGSLPLKRNSFKVRGSNPDPAYLAAKKLQEQLMIHGINCSESATTSRNFYISNVFLSNIRVPIYTTYSPKLSVIIAETNINSNNLFAEHCLIQSAIAMGVEPDNNKATKAILDFWKQKGLDIQGLSMNDGSGLSNYNLITPEQLVFILKYMKNKSDHFETFYQSLAIAGVSGTLKDITVGSAAQGNLHGKSGTVDRAKAYAGYVTTKSGREIAFSMTVNNFSCTPAEATKQLEKLMVALAKVDQ